MAAGVQNFIRAQAVLRLGDWGILIEVIDLPW